MSDIPAAVHITEEGPREGFQIEQGPIPTARKIALIDALSQTGLDHIQIVSFVNPKNVPGMADADTVVDNITPQPGVAYTALWLNEKGFARALKPDRLTNTGTIQLAASEKFSKRNQNRDAAQQLAGQHAIVEMYKAAGIPVERGSIMAAFGCNFAGDIPVAHVVALVPQILDVAKRARRYAEICHAGRHHGLGDAACDQAHHRRFARALARSRRRAAPARHPRHGDRQCLCRARNGGDAV